jgi:D,D-heptose 1,7-bisphosphate phosphatase
MSNTVRQACVLVGGKGTRLGELTRTTPKPLIEIGEGVSFIDILLDQISRQGFTDIILLAGHLGELIRQRYHRRMIGAAQVRVFVEPEAFGTAGALLTVREVLAPKFLLLNGDSFFDVNLRAIAAEEIASHQLALVALRWISDGSRYGSVDLNGKRITRFREKSTDVRSGALINAGIYMFTRAVLDRLQQPSSIETDLFPALAAEGKLAGIICAGYFLDIGQPESLEEGRRELLGLRRRAAVFLDRDGVLNHDHGYVYRPDQIVWVQGAQKAIRRLNDLGFRVIVVTNQAGVAHGYYTESEVHTLHNWLQEELARYGAYIDAFYYCPYHPDARVEQYRAKHLDRKPDPGMILRAFQDLPINKDASFLVGDKESDIEAARSAGLPGFMFKGPDLEAFIEEHLVAYFQRHEGATGGHNDRSRRFLGMVNPHGQI